jgi:hypothetical protein
MNKYFTISDSSNFKNSVCILKIVEDLYKRSLNSDINDFVKEYNSKIKELIEGKIKYRYKNSYEILPAYIYLFDEMYYSNLKSSLLSFEFLIKEILTEKDSFFLKRRINKIIEDESDVRNPYKAIVIKTIKNHENKLELYVSIRKVYNMKYFFSRVKNIEKLNRIMEF